MYKQILVPVDGSAASTRGLETAIELARHLGVRLRLVHVVEPWVMVTWETASSAPQLADVIRANGLERLKEAEETVRKAGVEVESKLIETRGASAGECIVKEAKAVDADLIVCGTHGRRGIRRVLMGSDAEYIVRRAPVPVMLVRHQEESADREAA